LTYLANPKKNASQQGDFVFFEFTMHINLLAL